MLNDCSDHVSMSPLAATPSCSNRSNLLSHRDLMRSCPRVNALSASLKDSTQVRSHSKVLLFDWVFQPGINISGRISYTSKRRRVIASPQKSRPHVVNVTSISVISQLVRLCSVWPGPGGKTICRAFSTCHPVTRLRAVPLRLLLRLIWVLPLGLF